MINAWTTIHFTDTNSSQIEEIVSFLLEHAHYVGNMRVEAKLICSGELNKYSLKHEMFAPTLNYRAGEVAHFSHVRVSDPKINGSCQL